MRIIAKVIRISRANFIAKHIQDIRYYASLIFWHTMYTVVQKKRAKFG